MPLRWRWPLLVELPVEQVASRLRASQSHNLSIGELVRVFLDGDSVPLPQHGNPLTPLLEPKRRASRFALLLKAPNPQADDDQPPKSALAWQLPE